MPGVALAVIQAISTAASAFAAWRLSRNGLSRKYHIFFIFLIFRSFYLLLPFFLDLKSDWYEYVWVVGSAVAWGFYVGVVVELIGLILSRHRGFLTIGRWAIYVALAISTTFSIISLLPKITPLMPQPTRILGYVFAGERGVDVGLSIFLLVFLSLMTLYTVPLSRNVVIHAAIYTVFLLVSTMNMALRSIFGLKYVTELDTARTIVTAACTLAWCLLLSAKGEGTRVRQPWFGPEREERILDRLDAFNATILRVARK